MFARSSKRALSSTRQTACLPRSAARISAGTSGESSRRAVHGLLDREHVGVVDRLLDEALDRGRRTSRRGGGRGCRRLRIAASTSGCSSSSACRRGWVTGVHGGSRSSAKPGSFDDLPQVVRGRAGRRRRRRRRASTSSARVSLLAHRRAHAGADLDAHDLAEAPAAQLVLDRLQQVVGLVGDREVGVAGDAEDVVVEDLHAREQRVEVRRDEVLERHERVGPSPTGTKRGSISFGTFTRANVSRVGDRVAHEHAERQRQVGDVRERPPEADGQRRQHGEDLAPEALVERRAARASVTSS